MESRMEQIGKVRCSIWMHGRGGPAIYWGTASSGKEQQEKTAGFIARMAGEKPWTMVAFEMENWNRDYSPWALPSENDQADFAGGAKDTLVWLTDVCIPHIERRVLHGVSQRMIGGYSLAGLFSLFAFYESGLFEGAASCSGSLWYPGWKEYAGNQTCPVGSVVYLSLGRKEEKTRSPMMSQVGDMTRWQYERLKQDANVRASELVWHNGGHFTDVEQRIAQGFSWLIEHAGNR